MCATHPPLTIPLDSSTSSLTCARADGELRLANVPSPGRGLVQVFWNGRWGTLSQDNFGIRQARATCRQLGWQTGAPVYGAALRYGRRAEPVYTLNTYDCDWAADRLYDCVLQRRLDLLNPNALMDNGTSYNFTAGVECRNGGWVRYVHPSLHVRTRAVSCLISQPEPLSACFVAGSMPFLPSGLMNMMKLVGCGRTGAPVQTWMGNPQPSAPSSTTTAGGRTARQNADFALWQCD
jgi:hypothetical protein